MKLSDILFLDMFKTLYPSFSRNNFFTAHLLRLTFTKKDINIIHGDFNYVKNY